LNLLAAAEEAVAARDMRRHLDVQEEAVVAVRLTPASLCRHHRWLTRKLLSLVLAELAGPQ
jgi:hypothetical protein